MEDLRQSDTREAGEGVGRRTKVSLAVIAAISLTLLFLPSGAIAQGSKESESTRSAPPDTTPYVRPAVPEDYAPSGKPAIPSKVSKEHPKAKPPATPSQDEDGGEKTKKKAQ